MILIYKNFEELVETTNLHPEYIRSFFNTVVENCAKIAEEQAATFDGSNKEIVGCHNVAAAIRVFGK